MLQVTALHYFLAGFHRVHPVIPFITARSSGQFFHLVPLGYHTGTGQQLLFNFYMLNNPLEISTGKRNVCFSNVCIETLAMLMQLNQGEPSNSRREQYCAMPKMHEVQTRRS